MSVYGIRPNPLGAPPARVQPQSPRVDRQPTGTPAPAAAPTRAREIATPNGTSAQTLPVEAPVGTDPELWAVLSADERAYFAKVGAMGPLTYGRVMAGGQYTPAANAGAYARGGRLDVKA